MPFPFLIHNKKITRLELPGVPLGLLEEAAYDELQFQIDPGDTLILFSDGVADALDRGGDFYDMNRFLDSIHRHSTEAVPELLKNLYAELRQFIGEAEISDDVTIIALRRKP
jgi:sigma-B regulation protein RsbU (phosphoserine phosphatase)